MSVGPSLTQAALLAHLADVTTSDGVVHVRPRKTRTQVRLLPKYGRNDPCPCGNGRKFKRCHGRRS